MTDIAARKALIVAQADLHRELLVLERRHLQRQGESARAAVGRYRWWLLGGAVVGGLLLTRSSRSFAGWLPAILTVARTILR